MAKYSSSAQVIASLTQTVIQGASQATIPERDPQVPLISVYRFRTTVRLMDLKAILTTASQIAPLASALTAIVAAVFISRQVANIRRNREVDTLFKIIALADSERMREGIHWLTYEVNRTLTLQELVNDKETFSKFSRVVHLFETIGVIVNNGYISENLIFDKYGILVIAAWGKLRNQINVYRADWGSDEYAENFELLVSKYNSWARRTALKTAKGERVTLRDGRYLLNYERPKKHDDPVGTSSG